MASIARLERINAERLGALLLTEPTADRVAVVDVRDSDHVGGHIRGSRHWPSTTLAHAAPELVRSLQRAERVVFHCALSQERGPSAALRYIRERERMFGPGSVALGAKWTDEGGGEGGKAGTAGKAARAEAERDETGAVKAQAVFVLDRGFVRWQQKYLFPSVPPSDS